MYKLTFLLKVDWNEEEYLCIYDINFLQKGSLENEDSSISQPRLQSKFL